MKGSVEGRDRELFNEISHQYTQKDLYPPSSFARKIQVEILMRSVHRIHGREKFHSILEIGCGSGANSVYLRPFYEKYLGLDYSHQLIRHAKEKYETENARFLNANLKQFSGYHEHDLILGIGVLHHITELQDALIRMKEKSRKGTILAFLEPQSGNPALQLLRRIRQVLDRNYSRDQVFFSKNELREYLTRAGFDVKNLSYTGYFSVPFSQVMLKPRWLFMPLSKAASFLDTKLYRLDSRLGWNISAVMSAG
jgi:2-polyprenyl-3-methyl-5-hydroxy-6-metoxy-1,4-benzoquinol methylase